jgi:hypothetical protein
MGSSSFLNAFRMLGRRPVLLLLLLPIHVALPLLNRQMLQPILQDIVNSGSIQNFIALFNYLGVLLLLSLAAAIFLVPPALELLHGEAEGATDQAGWYGRGIRKHGWKPLALGAVEIVIFTVLSLLFVLLVQGIFPDLVQNGFSVTSQSQVLEAFIVLILGLFFILVLYYIACIFAFLLPAMVDRSFDEAAKAVLKGSGLRKSFKVYGVFLLTEIVSLLVTIAAGIGYVLLTSMPSSFYDFLTIYSDFSATWVGFGVSVLVSFTIAFKYPYVFSVFQEIKNKEKE